MEHSDQDATNEFVSAVDLLPEAVTSIVGYRMVDPTPVIHRGLPSPSLTMVLTLEEPIVTGTSPEHARSPTAYRAEIVLGALHTRPVYIAQPSEQAGLQLSIRPLAARALFGIPPKELNQLVTEGADVLGKSAVHLREQLAEQTTWQERFAALSGYLRHRYDPTRQPRPEVVEAWKWIAHHRGNGSITGLARHVRLSTRQLTALFRAELGITPKALSRLIRFEHARQRIARAVRSGAPIDIAAIASGCGYYDHSHLVNDFQQYVGTSPSGWLAEERRNIQAGAYQSEADSMP